MKNILYYKPSDATKFDLERFSKSLNKYGKVSKSEIEEALKKVDQYENMHVSVLVEVGVGLLMQTSDSAAEKYFNEHSQYFSNEKFERLRRITGYLVGTLDRWNDGKKAEEKARVKHSVNSALDDRERAIQLENQAMAHNIAYVGMTE